MKPRGLAAGSIFVFAACLLLSLALSTPSLLAQEKTMVGGKLTCSFVDQKQFAVGNTEGHVLSLTQSTGINTSTKAKVLMDGASVVNYSIGDLVKGNGPQFGYIMFAKGPDTTYAKWEHATTTIMTPEAKPQTTIKGTFSFIRGTGQFANIQGSGQYNGVFTSPTDYTVEWEGEYIIKK